MSSNLLQREQQEDSTSRWYMTRSSWGNLTWNNKKIKQRLIRILQFVLQPIYKKDSLNYPAHSKCIIAIPKAEMFSVSYSSSPFYFQPQRYKVKIHIVSLVSEHLFQFSLSQNLACFALLAFFRFFPMHTTCNYTGKIEILTNYTALEIPFKRASLQIRCVILVWHFVTQYWIKPH